MIATERRSTVRGQAAAARKKIAAMQIQDDDEDDDEEQFKKLFGRQRTKKSKDTAVVPTKTTEDLSDVSVSYYFFQCHFSNFNLLKSISSNTESLFTPPTARKRLTTDRTGDDELAAGRNFHIFFVYLYYLEHGTPPKTPRTNRRNRIDDQTSIQVNFSLIIFRLYLYI
jgi:hypothetical protein